MQRALIRARVAALLALPAVACGKVASHEASNSSVDTAAPAAPAATGAPATTETSARPAPDSAAQVILRYYDAIQRRDFAAAFAMWSGGGSASGQSRDAFAAGFSQTSGVKARITGKVRVEGAAGSQYATVPVEVDATLLNGTEQHFAGSYVVRRSMVDGATDEQRRWRIYSASIRPR